MADTFKFRIDHHGSLVRPAEVLNARARHAAGELDDTGLRAVEDEAITESARYQRRLRMSVATDGEFRRADFRGAILGLVGGIRPTGDTDKYGRPRWAVDGELKASGPLIADGYDGVKKTAGTAAPKATLPSPAYLAATCYDPAMSTAAYPSAIEFGEALARIVRDEIELLIARGVRLVQLNNFRYASYVFDRGGQPLTLDEAVAIDSIAVDVRDKPEDVRIGMCPTHRADPVNRDAAARLFGGLPVDRWVLPYDKGTEAELDLLRAVPADRDAALGIVDPTVAELEDVETIMQRMDAAAELKDIEDIAVLPSAGFSDVAGGGKISADDQRRKLIHVETIARMCWGNEL
ncbi:uroporphyrinogen decarboxylase/cobalamine-independent methonine synthase family protein [Actinomadura algeriensis]|uniref:5-methyltetrahydropteroyltriglutamate--homocysteine methyltransferase n=1 Tax=Actinomadura algeriensis TaxID=1679523 RepID=A0ABR9K1Z5_9ACTN|nr:methionine synthase II (cobalamin-independent)-like protein [Actinomadura algeriensis]MBE1536624.1 5-methyltetrahydropteroyltriglutamate--homocysteine methyltransferase [Actinomadura algeriensis]